MKYDCFIIDDEKLLADSTAEYFNLFGVKTAAAYSVYECRDFFREHTAQLLLLDINLGDGSGFELCRELREKTDVPILFISARTSDDDQIIGLYTEALLPQRPPGQSESRPETVRGTGGFCLLRRLADR